MTDDLVRDLRDVDASMLPVVGGKGANLGELIRARLPVPPGFCLTTGAYLQVAAGARLEAVLAELAATAPGDATQLASAAARARGALLAAPVPPAIAEALRAAYQRLGPDAAVAVRSSATAEDLPFASFAGQQDTYLNVVGAAAVLDAVRRCWASLWTDRAVSYRAAAGIDPRDVRLAVVVQRMVDARVAGVLFTANPVTGKRTEAVIDASPGLGEAVVSGAVNPDHFVVDSVTGAIVERRLGDKRIVIRARAAGGTEQVAQATGGGLASLTDDEIRALAALGRRVAGHYGSPQDTEWAIDAGGRLWLTQARPITTLFPVPRSPRAASDDLRVYVCLTLVQGLTRPITPMGLAVFRLVASGAIRLFDPAAVVPEPLAGPAGFVAAGQRAFVDFTAVLRNRLGREAVLRILGVMEARSAVVLGQLGDDPRLSVVQRSRWPVLRRLLAIAARFAIPVHFIGALLRPRAAREGLRRVEARLRQRLALAPGATPAARLDHVERIILTEMIPLLPTAAPPPGAGFAMLGVARWLLGDQVRPGELQTVLRGLPHNVTTEMDLALWALASRIKQASAASLFQKTSADELCRLFRAGGLPAAAQEGLRDFLARYGHRAVAEIDVGMPRWSDDPRHVLNVLVNYLRLDDPAQAPEAMFQRGAAEADAAITALVARMASRDWLRAPLLRFALDRTRQLAGLRETPKFLLVVVLGAARQHLAQVGAGLAAAGRIAAPDDIFFLDLQEARRALAGEDLRALVAERRSAYDQELRRRHVPRVLLSDGTEPEALARHALAPTAAGDGATLVGTAASAGTVTASARVVLDPTGAHLEPGEILVAPSTDPGWTPLFLTAGGLVMEMGGANSHGAVVAREYGIPAVVGVPDATLHITTGQRITLDGAAGTITPA